LNLLDLSLSVEGSVSTQEEVRDLGTSAVSLMAVGMARELRTTPMAHTSTGFPCPDFLKISGAWRENGISTRSVELEMGFRSTM
jgi:hypothetical protein